MFRLVNPRNEYSLFASKAERVFFSVEMDCGAASSAHILHSIETLVGQKNFNN
jgi:hypothetical protein